MSRGDYWHRFMTREISRRLSMAMIAGGSAAAVLAACGGGKSNGSATSSGGTGGVGTVPSAKDKSGLLSTPVDTTKNAVPGGVWQYFLTGDVEHFDPMDAQRGVLTNALNVYSQPLKFKFGTIDSPPNGSFTGDAAESWELSGDGLQITFKLRQNVKLDPRPPTNGRLLDADDWVYSWNTFAAKAPAASELSTKRNPDSPIESFTNPDKRTVVVKLAYPFAPILGQIADTRYSFCIVPVEHDGKYNAHAESRGSGPFVLQRWDPSSRVEYRRNPNFWDSPRPYLGGIDQPIVTEYAQRLAQLNAGNLWYVDVRQEDILGAKKSIPKLNMWKFPLALNPTTPVAFSSKPTSVFRDIRVRQGASMLVDRDALNDLNFNISSFEKAGIGLTARNSTIVTSGDTRFWVDYKDLGEGGKWHQYNKDEAAKLLRAAGVMNQDLPVNVRMSTAGSAPVTPQVQAFTAMFADGGFFKPAINLLNPVDSNTFIHRGKGGWLRRHCPLQQRQRNGPGICPHSLLLDE